MKEWNYERPEMPNGGDGRKIVTLLDGGMVWVGIRFWNNQQRCWWNNGEPEKAEVLAWQDLPWPANKRWIRGQLIGSEMGDHETERLLEKS